MAQRAATTQPIRVRARNIGGIEETEVTLPPGVTVLRGRNATHRTSFLQAIMAGLGSDKPTLKGDADEGEVALEIGDDVYTRTVARRNGDVVYDGDPYLEDPEAADLFVFLLGNNEARQAVARGDDLREIIMRPIDTEAIEAEIRARTRERDELDEKLEKLSELEAQLPGMEETRTGLQEELEAKREQLDEVQSAIAQADADLDESRTHQNQVEETFDALRTARSNLKDLRFERSTEEATLEELTAKRDELESTLEASSTPDRDPERLATRIGELRQQKQALDETLAQLQSVIGFNEEMLADDGLLVDLAPDGETAGDPTEQLVTDSEQTVCWSCGSQVNQENIQAMLEQLRAFHKEKLAGRNELQDEIDELAARRNDVLERTEKREQAEQRLGEVETEIEECRDRLETLEATIAETEAEISELEAAAQDTGEADYERIIELHQDATELEIEIEQLESDLDSVESEIAETESALAKREQLQADREALTEELTELRTQVDRIETDAVDSFNEHMGTVLEILGYDNIDRIWIERRKLDDGRQNVDDAEFDLHVIRSDAEGTVYRDAVAHLSESERAVTGLVFALAGYLAHEVYEELPFMLLDSLEVIDANRIARIVEYFSDYVEYLVVALLPEDAAAIDVEHEVVSEIVTEQ